MISLAINNVMI